MTRGTCEHVINGRCIQRYTIYSITIYRLFVKRTHLYNSSHTLDIFVSSLRYEDNTLANIMRIYLYIYIYIYIYILYNINLSYTLNIYVKPFNDFNDSNDNTRSPPLILLYCYTCANKNLVTCTVFFTM